MNHHYKRYFGDCCIPKWQDTNLNANNSAASSIDPHWWQAFGSLALNRLITEVLNSNNDLGIAHQRIAQTKAQAKIAGANLWPALGVQGSLSENHNNSGDTLKSSGQFTVAYEVDLWGANQARSNAGSARLLSTIFARDALKLVLMANASQTYFNLLALDERQRVASEFLHNLEEVLSIVAARYQAGAVSELDVLQQQTEVATAQASLELLRQQHKLAENALAILQGHAPQPLGYSDEHFFAIQMPEVNTLQPAALLQRRPDIRQAEMELIAANADISVARAQSCK